MDATRFWTATRNAALKVVAFWVLVFAAYLALGRQFFPYIDQLKPEVEIWLSGRLGTEVHVGQLRGEWVRFNPVLHLSDVTLGDDLSISEMTLAPGIYESISRGGISFIKFELTDFAAEIYQDSSGWQMRGLETPDAESSQIDLNYLIQLFQRQQEVQFTNALLSIQPQDLPAFTLTLNSGRLSGYGGDNGLVANAVLRANDFEIPIELQVETSQNPDRSNRAYFRHGLIDLSPWLSDVTPKINNVLVKGEYWLNFEKDQWANLTARLSADTIHISGRHNDIDFKSLKFETYIDREKNGFEGWLNFLEYQVNGHQYNSTQAKISHRANRIKLQWDSLPADLVGYWYALDDPGGFWQGISPRGFLEQGIVTLERDIPGSIEVAASIEDFSISPVQSVPGLDNLNGTLRMEGSSGEMNFKSDRSILSLPGLYQNGFSTKIDTATMYWQIDPSKGIFTQGHGDLSLANAANDNTQLESLPVSVQWQSVTPPVSERKKGREGALELNVQTERFQAPWLMHLADNSIVDPNTTALINYRLHQSEFENIELNFLSSTNIDHQKFDQFFLNASFSQAEMGFLDNWSDIRNFSGEFSLNNQGLMVTSQSAIYPGFSIDEVIMSLDFATSELQVELVANSSGQEVMTFLKAGPLRPQFGSVLDDWHADGFVDLDLQISMPLNDHDALNILVETDIKETQFIMKDIELGFDDVNGQFVYDTKKGISTRNLSATHLGYKQEVEVTSDLTTDNIIFNISAKGQTPVSYWGARFDDIYLQKQNVPIAHETHIVIDSSKTKIRSTSNLNGLALDFPEPFTKPENSELPLELEITFDERDWTTIRANLGDSLVSYFEMNTQNEIQRGTVAINNELVVREENGVYFDITVNDADGDDWWRAIQDLKVLYSSEPQDDKPSFETLISAINLGSKTITYLDQPWSEVDASILRNDEAWIMSFISEEGRGQMLIPHSDEAIFADIQWLSMRTGEEDVAFEDQIDPLLSYLPSDVPDLSLQLNKLIWNDKDMGSWRSHISVSDDILVAQDIVGQMNSAVLNGELVWSKSDGKHKTSFIGDIKTGNILNVLNTWGYAPILTSRDGVFNVDAFWQGSPAHFDFKRLQGEIDLLLNRGAILEVEEYEGIKLIGLLNFTRVIQRIALDFSDLVQTGITFDTIEGELLFDRGFARVGEDLLIDGSATKFKFSGDADLLGDELDIDMILTVPLSSTFPLVALLAGVSPQAAAAIYVTERVFNNELERISSARMHITGSFESPEIRFYRVSEDVLSGDEPNALD